MDETQIRGAARVCRPGLLEGRGLTSIDSTCKQLCGLQAWRMSIANNTVTQWLVGRRHAHIITFRIPPRIVKQQTSILAKNGDKQTRDRPTAMHPFVSPLGRNEQTAVVLTPNPADSRKRLHRNQCRNCPVKALEDTMDSYDLIEDNGRESTAEAMEGGSRSSHDITAQPQTRTIPATASSSWDGRESDEASAGISYEWASAA
ncbi:hypothetical protein N657DRAFT_648784 [Parathielavia appendiculata]|uniref:Uncharacterized protein n=1 Tax=Parathielavia appendiculata TaxID=2587402 RepID=A0AAN6Z080_9PEZI|nr:hypothetical protein N657DRAFT_648784 [Parathielavia appendiculata]